MCLFSNISVTCSMYLFECNLTHSHINTTYVFFRSSTVISDWDIIFLLYWDVSHYSYYRFDRPQPSPPSWFAGEVQTVLFRDWHPPRKHCASSPKWYVDYTVNGKDRNLFFNTAHVSFSFFFCFIFRRVPRCLVSTRHANDLRAVLQ